MVESPRRVFILSPYPLFREGVKSLLASRPEVEVVGCDKEWSAARGKIENLRPDLILVDRTEMQFDHAAIMDLLQAVPGADVIGLDLQTNTLCLYRQERHIVREVQDLVHII